MSLPGGTSPGASKALWLTLTALFLCLAAGLGLLLYRDLSRSLADQWNARLQSAAEERASLLDAYLQEEMDHLRVLTTYPTLRYVLGVRKKGEDTPFPSDQGPMEHLGELLQSATLHTDFSALWLLNDEGVVLLAQGSEKSSLDEKRLQTLARGVELVETDEAVSIAFKLEVKDQQRTLGWLVFLLPSSALDEFNSQSHEDDRIEFLLTARVGDTPETRVLSTHGYQGTTKHEHLAATAPLQTTTLWVTAQVDTWVPRSERTYLKSALALLALSIVVAVGIIVYAYLREDKLRRRITRLKNEAQLSPLMNWAPDPILFLDKQEKVVYTNGMALTVLGYDEGELEGRTFSDIHFSGLSLERLLDSEEKLITTSIRRKDGTECPVEMRWQMIIDGSDATTLVIARDLSERFRMQERVEEAQRLLADGQKMEAIGRLAGGVAHDFNNLLTVIGGYAELIGTETDTESLSRELKGAVVRAKELTDQLLTFSQRHSNAPDSFDLRPLFKRSVSLVSRLFPEDIEFHMEIDREHHPVFLNQTDAEHLIFNLLVNARDAIRGQGSVTASLARRTFEEEQSWAGGVIPPGDYSEIKIEDTGEGMNDEVKRQIFEPFFTTKPPGQGTGMGLATVFGVAQQAGGGILVDSEVNAGTTFRILLPIRPEASATSAVPTENAGSAPSHARRTRIILVEDERAVQRLLTRVLERGGFSVECASNGREAVEEYAERAEEFDILLTDVVMPEMRGPEVAEFLKKKNPRLQVVFMSGYTDGALAGKEDWGGLFVQKPFSPGELLQTLRGLCADEEGE